MTNIQERRPYQNYGRILMAKPEGTSSYHGLQLSLERRMASTLSVEANYTWSKAIDQFSSDPSPGFGALSVRGNLRLNQGLSDFDVPHRFVTAYVWVLPRLTNAPGILRWTIGGWETSGTWTLQSGRPFSLMSGVDNAFSGINSDRADLVGNPDLPDDRPKQEWLNEYFQHQCFRPERARNVRHRAS